MIKVVIVDDEQHCIDRLTHLLVPAYNNILTVVGSATTVEEGIRSVTLLRPSLVFLDVQIYEKTGFDLLRALPDINFAVIFTTAYEKFAIQAIKFSAIDYLLKPIDEEELSIALLKLIDTSVKKTASEKIDILLQNTQANGVHKKIIVPTVSGFELVDITNIVRCQSDINYTTIFLKDKQKFVVSKTLKDFEEMLTLYAFFRVHNSHLINLSFIKSYNKGNGGYVILTDGTEIEVSSRRKEDLLKRLACI